jgi:hypothetical protein
LVTWLLDNEGVWLCLHLQSILDCHCGLLSHYHHHNNHKYCLQFSNSYFLTTVITTNYFYSRTTKHPYIKHTKAQVLITDLLFPPPYSIYVRGLLNMFSYHVSSIYCCVDLCPWVGVEMLHACYTTLLRFSCFGPAVCCSGVK